MESFKEFSNNSQHSIQMLKGLRYMQLCPFRSLLVVPSTPVAHYSQDCSIPIYKAIAIKPAKAAARPSSSFPAAPVVSAASPVDVPVPALVGLGAEPDAVARVEL